jgi:hypothetical protein
LRGKRPAFKHGRVVVRGFALARSTAYPQARGSFRALVGASTFALLIVGCNQEAKTEPPLPRPIMLTAVSTVLGLIPIAPTVFWGPMAFAIMGGLFVATLLTLLVLPVFYITLYRARQPVATAA